MKAPVTPSVSLSGWIDTPPVRIAPRDRETHVRYCSYFAGNVLDRYPQWAEGLDQHQAPVANTLQTFVTHAGLDAGLRRFRNQQMLRIIWRDLCGLATLAETFSDLTRLAELCLQTAIDVHAHRLQENMANHAGVTAASKGCLLSVWANSGEVNSTCLRILM